MSRLVERKCEHCKQKFYFLLKKIDKTLCEDCFEEDLEDYVDKIANQVEWLEEHRINKKNYE